MTWTFTIESSTTALILSNSGHLVNFINLTQKRIHLKPIDTKRILTYIKGIIKAKCNELYIDKRRFFFIRLYHNDA